jgi:uncharacterized membrane protein
MAIIQKFIKEITQRPGTIFSTSLKIVLYLFIALVVLILSLVVVIIIFPKSKNSDADYSAVIEYFKLNKISNIPSYKDYTFIVGDTLFGTYYNVDAKQPGTETNLYITLLNDTSTKITLPMGSPGYGGLTEIFHYYDSFFYGYTEYKGGFCKIGLSSEFEKMRFGNKYIPEEFDFGYTDSLMVFYANNSFEVFNLKNEKMIIKRSKNEFDSKFIHPIMLSNRTLLTQAIYHDSSSRHGIVTLRAYNPVNFKIEWSKSYPLDQFRIYNAEYANLTMRKNELRNNKPHFILQTNNSIFVIDMYSGVILYEYEKSNEDVFKVPIHTDSDTIIISNNQKVFCINYKQNKVLWEKAFGFKFNSALIWKKHLILYTNDSVHVAPLNNLNITKGFDRNNFPLLSKSRFNDYIYIDNSIYN